MIGTKLKKLIRLRNVKQIDLAKHLGISPSRLSNYLSDKREPDLDLLAKIAKFLSVDLNYFTDVKFGTAKKDIKDINYSNRHETSSTTFSESTTAYASGDIIKIPRLKTNSKKRAEKTTNMLIPIYSDLTSGVKNPEENVNFFEVSTGIGGNKFKQGDFLVAAEFTSIMPKSGNIVFEMGRNGKCYKYIEDKDAKMLLSEDSCEVIFLNNNTRLEGFFVVLWVLKKAY